MKFSGSAGDPRALMPRLFYPCFLFLIALIGVLPASAQSASMSGLVTDPSGAVVSNAKLTLLDEKTGTTQSAKTNTTGFYSFSFLQPGTYTLNVESQGFKKYEQTHITVSVAQNLAIEVRLQVGSASESVNVDGSGININTIDASVSTVVDRQFVENIPLNGRSFQSLLTTIPGVAVVASSGVGSSGEITVNGQRTEANYFTVDGVSANTGAYSGTTPGESVLGTTQSMVSIDALEEFRAITSTYSAEYGRTPGGQFIFTTRSGTNNWHGSTFDYFRNDVLDSNAYFNGYQNNPPKAKQAERQNEFGGTFGGPLWLPGLYNGKNRTFFFFSYEGLRLISPTPSQRYRVPSVNLRETADPTQRPLLNIFPLPDDPAEDQDGSAYFASGYSTPSSLDSTSIRIDHSFTDSFKVFGRYATTPSDAVSRGFSEPSTLQTSHRNIDTLTLGATNMFSSRFSNEARFNITLNQAPGSSVIDTFGGATPISITDIPGLKQGDSFEYYFYNSYPGIGESHWRQRQLNVTDGFNMSFGRHSVKVGFDYRRLVNSASVPSWDEWAFANAESARINNYSLIGLYRYANPPHPIYDNISFYGQDEWKATNRLNLSLGVRWEVNPSPGDRDGQLPYTIDQIDDLLTTKLAPKNTQLWKTTYTNFAPRFGIAYQVHQQPGHETVVRVGGGLFYDTGNNYASTGYGAGIGSQLRYFTSGPYPVSQETLDNVPAISVSTPYNSTVVGYDPHLKLPYTLQWSAAVQQNLGKDQTLTLSYVAAAARRLLSTRSYNLGHIGNPNFVDSSSSQLLLTQNGSSSDYHSLQVQFQRRLSHGLQALLAYTWSHANDDVTTNAEVYQLLKADSDNDIRHNFQAALTYDLPGEGLTSWYSRPLKHWSIDSRIMARSAQPVDINTGLTISEATGSVTNVHPDRIWSRPLYLYDSTMPGGRQINPNAFEVAMDASGNAVEGSAGRNAARGFSAIQADIAFRKDFPIFEKLGLQFRVEAFNIFNHPNFGSIYTSLNQGSDALGRNAFGQAYTTLNNSLGGMNALYQIGGPRSMQLALKLHF